MSADDLDGVEGAGGHGDRLVGGLADADVVLGLFLGWLLSGEAHFPPGAGAEGPGRPRRWGYVPVLALPVHLVHVIGEVLLPIVGLARGTGPDDVEGLPVERLLVVEGPDERPLAPGTFPPVGPCVTTLPFRRDQSRSPRCRRRARGLARGSARAAPALPLPAPAPPQARAPRLEVAVRGAVRESHPDLPIPVDTVEEEPGVVAALLPPVPRHLLREVVRAGRADGQEPGEADGADLARCRRPRPPFVTERLTEGLAHAAITIS